MKILSAVQLMRGRSETWQVTFSEIITPENKPEMIRLLQGLSWLWQATITTVSPDTVIYHGWTD